MNSWSRGFWVFFAAYLLFLPLWQTGGLRLQETMSTSAVWTIDSGTITEDTNDFPYFNVISYKGIAIPQPLKITPNFWWRVHDSTKVEWAIFKPRFAHYANQIPVILSLTTSVIIFPFHSFH